ncbi:MAG: cysteine hydrolase [Butyrivibrio sp.]|nr:cysteine hydrolase [Butyrivibrio sp.]
MELLLVIDIQEKYMEFYRADLIDAVNAHIAYAKENNIPVIYIKNVGLLGDSEDYKFADELKIVSDDIFLKKIPSAFSNDLFFKRLKEMVIDTIDVVGVDGRCCVYKTVMDAVKLGYRVRLHLDAIAARSDKFYSKELESMKAAGVIAERKEPL